MSKPQTRRISALIPYARNARSHSDRQIEQLVASMLQFGWTMPVLIDEDGGMIAGHGRVLAAAVIYENDGEIQGLDGQPLPKGHAPILIAKGWSEAKKRAYVIADNKLAENASWNDELLRFELELLDTEGFELPLLGFELDEITARLNPPNKGKADADPEKTPKPPAKPVSRPGDVWLMGAHRLICGDCTNREDIAKVLGGAQPDLCLTDPPYGLGEKKASGKNDYAEYQDSRENLEALAAKWLPIARELCPAVVFSPGVTNQWIYPEPNWVLCWFYGGGQLRSPWGFNCWQPFLCYGKDPSLSTGHGARPDAVDLNTPANAGDLDHPCPKPVKLWEWLIGRMLFEPARVIYEPFSGSGTTLIAGEMLGHQVRAIELTPRYVDVAVMRWEEFSDRVATLEATGQTYREVAEERLSAKRPAKKAATEAAAS